MCCKLIYRNLIVAVHIRWTSFGQLLTQPSATSTSLPRPAFLLTCLVPHCSAGCQCCLLAASQCAAKHSTTVQRCSAGAPWISTNAWCHASNVATSTLPIKCFEDHVLQKAFQAAWFTSSMVLNGYPFGELTYPFPKRWFSFSKVECVTFLEGVSFFPLPPPWTSPRCADSTCCWIICFLRSRNLL